MYDRVHLMDMVCFQMRLAVSERQVKMVRKDNREMKRTSKHHLNFPISL